MTIRERILAGAYAIALMLRRYSETLVRTAVANPLFEVVRGFIFLIVAPVASVILLLTVIGAPIGFLGLVAFVGVLIFTVLATPIVIGSVVYRLLFKSEDYEVSWKTILLGTAIYVLLGLIPLIGWIAKFGVILLTLGAVLNIKWGIIKEWR